MFTRFGKTETKKVMAITLVDHCNKYWVHCQSFEAN